VEPRQFLAARADAEPDDADVVEVREDAQPIERGPEGADAAVFDGRCQFFDQRLDLLVVGVAEEL